MRPTSSGSYTTASGSRRRSSSASVVFPAPNPPLSQIITGTKYRAFPLCDPGGAAAALFEGRGRTYLLVRRVNYSRARIWLSSDVIWPRTPDRPPPFSRAATAHSRLPSRLPAPGTAVMFRCTWLSVTTRPSRLRFNDPSTRSRTWHARTWLVALALAPLVVAPVLTGMVTVWLTVPSLVPLASVIVPLSRPVASRTPLATENFFGVKVPAKVPWPSALVNVPVTVEVIVPGTAAGAAAAGVAAAAREAACAVAALATLAV